MQNSYLVHHGIKGQKWGVRRFQNEDGSLTPAGQKRYSSISPDRLRKELYSQVKKKRKEQYGSGYQWQVNKAIGPNSIKEQERFTKDYNEYTSTPEYKNAFKKLKRLDKDFETGKINTNAYDEQYNQITNDMYDPKFNRGVIVGNDGRKYAKEYLDTYGKDLNVAYLMDLGYSKEVSNYLNGRLMQATKKLLNGM